MIKPKIGEPSTTDQRKRKLCEIIKGIRDTSSTTETQRGVINGAGKHFGSPKNNFALSTVGYAPFVIFIPCEGSG